MQKIIEEVKVTHASKYVKKPAQEITVDLAMLEVLKKFSKNRNIRQTGTMSIGGITGRKKRTRKE